MYVRVCGQHVFVSQAVALAVDTATASHMIRHRGQDVKVHYAGIVKFMSAYDNAFVKESALAACLEHSISMRLRFFFENKIRREYRGHGIGLIADREAPAEIDQAAAFRVNGEPLFSGLPDRPAETFVCRQLRSLCLGKTTAYVQGVDVGQCPVFQGINDLKARPLPFDEL